MRYIIIFCVSMIITLMTTPIVESALMRFNLMRSNYRDDLIPFASGIHIPLIGTVGSLILIEETKLALSFSVLLWGFCLFGLLDDIYGDRTTGGFLGHFGKLIKERRLTTGALKAIGGGFLSLFIATAIASSITDILLNVIIIALTANFCNLLDVRPGRALKGFFFLALIFVFFARTFNDLSLLALLFGTASGLAYFDLKETSMLGDTGTGTLGAGLGFIIALSVDVQAKTIIAIFLIIFHLVTEKWSFSTLIRSNRILSAIDNFGRRPIS